MTAIAMVFFIPWLICLRKAGYGSDYRDRLEHHAVVWNFLAIVMSILMLGLLTMMFADLFCAGGPR